MTKLVPPHDPNAERSLLGAVLLDGDALSTVVPLVTSADFHDTRHSKIFEAGVRLLSAGKRVDAVLIKAELERGGELEKIGGEAYLARLAAEVPSAGNAEDYARVVREKAIARRVLSACASIESATVHGGVQGAPLVDWAGKQILALLPRQAAAEPRIRHWRPFPVEVLPRPLRGFVDEAARAIGCDPAQIAVPLLAALAGCIGNKRRILLKPGWSEPAVIWAVLIARSGMLKSPALDAVLDHLDELETGRMTEHRCELKAHAELKRRWEKSKEGPPPERPVASRLLVRDVTVEALVARLVDNPRGLLLGRDELAAWLKGFDKYREGRGGDAHNWLELHGARPVIVDRKGEQSPLCVPRAAVSVAGGIQPDVLRSALRRDHFANGMAARLLMAMPPAMPRVWSEATIRPETRRQLDQIYENLLALPFASGHADEPVPLEVRLSPRARERWIAFYNGNGERIAAAGSDDLSAAFSKLEGYGARLALVFHSVRVVTGADRVSPHEIDLESMSGGIALAAWFTHETERVYGVFGETSEQRRRRETMEAVRRLGGGVTPRELARSSRKFQGEGGTERAEHDLADLVAAGAGRWRKRPAGKQGGRPTEEFVLDVDVDETSRLAERKNGEVPSTQPADAAPCPVDGTPAETRSESAPVSSTSTVQDRRSGQGRNGDPLPLEATE